MGRRNTEYTEAIKNQDEHELAVEMRIRIKISQL
jgi:hypothetical protein